MELPRAADGSRQRRRETVTGTKKEADRRLRELIREVETGRFSIERLTIAEIAKRVMSKHDCDQACKDDDHALHREGGWLASAKHRVSVGAHVRYEQLVRDFIVPSLGSLLSSEIRPAHVDAAIGKWRSH